VQQHGGRQLHHFLGRHRAGLRRRHRAHHYWRRVSLAEQSGTLMAAGSASPTFATNKILASDVVGISVTITG
jgi:hypothetical protein